MENRGPLVRNSQFTIHNSFTVGWMSWTQIEQLSAWHNQPIGTKANGLGGVDTELKFNGPLQIVTQLPKAGDRAALSQVTSAVGNDPSVASVGAPRLSPAGRTAVFRQ